MSLVWVVVVSMSFSSLLIENPGDHHSHRARRSSAAAWAWSENRRPANDLRARDGPALGRLSLAVGRWHAHPSVRSG
jgi:hypothetical protein